MTDSVSLETQPKKFKEIITEKKNNVIKYILELIQKYKIDTSMELMNGISISTALTLLPMVGNDRLIAHLQELAMYKDNQEILLALAIQKFKIKDIEECDVVKIKKYIDFFTTILHAE